MPDPTTRHQETGKMLYVENAPPEGTGRIRPASPSEIIEAALADFPSDEDVRSDAVADWCEIHLSHYDWETALSSVKALFQAVVDARRTEEEG